MASDKTHNETPSNIPKVPWESWWWTHRETSCTLDCLWYPGAALAVKLVANQAEVKKGQEESCCSQCLSVSNHADKNHTTPSAQQKISLSIYPYNITIQASGHLLSLSKQKSSLETLVMQVMAWNHPFSRKMVILHLESKEDWLGVQSYYVSQIQSPLVIQEQLTDQSLRVYIQCRYGSHWIVPGFFLGSCWHGSSVYCYLPSLWKA